MFSFAKKPAAQEVVLRDLTEDQLTQVAGGMSNDHDADDKKMKNDHDADDKKKWHRHHKHHKHHHHHNMCTCSDCSK